MNMPWYKAWQAKVIVDTPRGEKKQTIYGKTLVNAINTFPVPKYGTSEVSHQI